MGGDKTMNRVIAGLGCRRDCPSADILAVIRDASARAGRPVDAIAVPEFRADEAGVQAAAKTLALPLILVGRAALMGAQGRCLTRSAVARQATGFASVAEAAALAATGAERLLLARVANARATCALAEDSAP
jgi:cobalamin biosynthesis protein CbiG